MNSSIRQIQILTVLTILLFSGEISSRAEAKPVALPRVNVQLVTDEADAVHAILAKRRAHQIPAEENWRKLFTSEGYIRLSRREAAMKRPFTDESFKSFVLSDHLLAQSQVLAETLANWKQASC